MLNKYTTNRTAIGRTLKTALIAMSGIITASILWSATASATAVRVDWNPSVHPYGANEVGNTPYPARSTDSLLLNGGVLDTVGITNDSINHGYGAFTLIDVPNAFSADHYLTFSLLPTAGYQASLTALYLATDWTQGIGDYVLRTSQDGFISDILGFNLFGPNTQGYQGIGFDLNALDAFTSETIFHLHVFDTFQNDGISMIYGSVHTLGYGLWFGNVDVTAYTPPPDDETTGQLPEPETLFLMGLGLLGFGISRRKKIN